MSVSLAEPRLVPEARLLDASAIEAYRRDGLVVPPARIGREVPWHQDGEYWPIRPRATCSVWIALDPATPENGCMRYLPGSHAAGSAYPHRDAMRPDRVLGQEIEPASFDAAPARDDVLDAGQFSLHDIFLVHGSAHNRSAQRRAGFVVRYMPASRSAWPDGRYGCCAVPIAVATIFISAMARILPPRRGIRTTFDHLIGNRSARFRLSFRCSRAWHSCCSPISAHRAPRGRCAPSRGKAKRSAAWGWTSTQCRTSVGLLSPIGERIGRK